MTSVLEDAGIDLDKLQEIPLPSDPEEQALERARVDAVVAMTGRWINWQASKRRFLPELVRCDWDGEIVAQTQVRGRLVKGTIGVLACIEHARKTPAEWIAHLTKGRR